jgi:acetyl-CoA carboxylase biotin carboxyl carrier protein
VNTERRTDDRAGPGRGPADPDVAQEVLDQVLNQVRRNAVKLLSTLPRQPQALRVRAGAVSLEVEWNGHASATATVVTDEAAGQPASIAPEADDRHYVCAPMVGVFYVATAPGASPFVVPGDPVASGQQVGIVEAMKLMVPVESDVAGEVLEVLKENATPVEYGDKLFAVAPTVRDDG